MGNESKPYGNESKPYGNESKNKKTDPAAEDIIAAESGFRSVRLTDTRS